MFRLLSFKRKKKKSRARRHPERRFDELDGDDMRRLLDAIGANRAAHPDAPPLSITVASRVDGAGAQALGIVSAMLWAKGVGARYLHTPFSRMDHAVGGTREDWARRWETFLNLGHSETPAPPDARLVSLEEFLRDPAAGTRPGAVVAARAFHWRKFQTAGALRTLRSPLRAKYRAARKSRIPLHRGPPGALTVAIHVRRGDITLEHPRRRQFYTHDEPILNAIRSVRAIAVALDRPVRINLYSEGPPEMFAAFAAAGCELHLDGDAFEAFHNLVRADILVQAKSSFSYIAGLISTGLVLHEPYVGSTGKTFYRPAPGWIVRDAAGAFDTQAVHALLAAQPEQRGIGWWLSRPLQWSRRR